MRRGVEPGFTLIEVLVALTIAMLVLGVFAAASMEGIFTVHESARVEEALVRARSRLALSEARPVEGDFRGDDGDGFQWRVNTRVLDQFGKPPDQALTTLYDTTVWISWHSGGRFRDVRLDAERLFTPLPAPAAPPRR
jgi:Tfp pilus assembly protein FimT